VILNYEWLLVVVVAGLYLKDSTLLLQPDEAVLLPVRGKRWIAGFGLLNWKLLGKEPYLANPFAPQRPIFKLSWRMDREPVQHASSDGGQFPPSTLLQALGWLEPFVWVSWLAIFVLIPAGLFTTLGTHLALAAIIVLYLNIFTALVVVYCLRDRLGLGRKQLGALAFEVVACAPYSINLIRRISVGTKIEEDFTSAMARLLHADERREAMRQCLLRVDEQISAEPEDSPKAIAMQKCRARFVGKEENIQ
jgi:hypothetical protein